MENKITNFQLVEPYPSYSSPFLYPFDFRDYIVPSNTLKIPKKLDIFARKVEKQHLEKECSICQNNFSEGEKISEIACKHFYHYKCIKEWVKIKDSCPLCRKNIPFLER